MAVHDTRFTPSIDEFRSLAQQGNVIPVVATFVADVETPVSALAKLARRGGPCFLFESAEKNEESGRFSFIGADPLLLIQSRANVVSIYQDGKERKFSTERDPLTELKDVMAQFRFVGRADLPHFIGGAVGYVGFDVVRFFEPTVPVHSRDDLDLPEFAFMIARVVIVFDHRLRKMHVVSNAFCDGKNTDQAYDQAIRNLDWAAECLSERSNLRAIPTQKRATPPIPRSNTTREQFEAMVEKAKKSIAAGDIYQVVLSQRFETDFDGDEIDLYRCLRFGNPSPYMFCLKFTDDFTLLGSSPELHVRVGNGNAEIRPIAGTHRRGNNAAEDEELAKALLANPKERAEHVMLIDLARNDLGRVAEFGSVKVTEQMVVERYSHVMHIVSHVVARLRPEHDAFDVVRATFPAGTLSGAPKIRAMQIIAELEKTRRGFYGGMVGYFGFDGSHDSCITIRSMVLKGGKAYLQSGAGIVADSRPDREYQECIDKANAMLDAIARAKQVGQVSK